MLKIITSPSFVILLPVVAILVAPGAGSSVARVAASAVIILGAKIVGIEIDPAAWVSILTW